MDFHKNIFLITGILASAVFALVLFVGAAPVKSSTTALAHDAVSTCATSTTRDACYELNVSQLYPKYSVEEIFAVIRMVRQLDPQYQFCHVLAHKLGERVVAEDPTSWVDAMPLNPSDGMCSNGFIHGVVGGRFRAEVLSDETLEKLLPDFSRACERREHWNPSDLDRAICYHGMGHLYTFITDADLPHALALCSRTTAPGYERLCVEGVFMQIYQPLEPDDFELIKRMPDAPNKETVREYCARYKEPMYVGACLRESWPFAEAGIRDGTGVEAFCSGQPNSEETQRCYEAVSSLAGRMSLANVDKVVSVCGHYPTAWQHICFSFGAEAVLQEDRLNTKQALEVCALAGAAADHCYLQLLSHAGYLFGENRSQHQAFCAALPAPMRESCVRFIP